VLFRSGALACALWFAGAVAAIAVLQAVFAQPGVILSLGGLELIERTPRGIAVLGFMPVAPVTLISLGLLIGVSLLTAPPAAATLGRYFTPRPGAAPQS